MSETKPSTDADEADEPLLKGLDLYWSPPRNLEDERRERPTPYRAALTSSGCGAESAAAFITRTGKPSTESRRPAARAGIIHSGVKPVSGEAPDPAHLPHQKQPRSE